MHSPWQSPLFRLRFRRKARLKVRLPPAREHGAAEEDHHVIPFGEALPHGPSPASRIPDKVHILVLPPLGPEGTEGVVVCVAVNGQDVVRVGEGVGVPRKGIDEYVKVKINKCITSKRTN